MFSYRHAFHAGNHADALKHAVLVHLLAHLLKKDSPFFYIDTHAGAGRYELDRGWADQSGEADTGVHAVWAEWTASAPSTSGPPAPQHDAASHTPPVPAANPASLPPLLIQQWLEAVAALNGRGRLRHYPGSPQIAWQMLRPIDRLRLFEAHPTEIDVLRRHFRQADRRLVISGEDGFAGLKALLPPPPRRALVLIDPSYEDKADYRRVVSAVRDGLQRFATGMYAIWYPMVQRAESERLAQQILPLAPRGWVHATLKVCAPAPGGHGLHGSGMIVLNPPFTLADALRDALPWLLPRLAQDHSARWLVENGGD